MGNREDVLRRLVVELKGGLKQDANYRHLAQLVWDSANKLSALEDKQFREYLQWFEGNLDTLLSVDASSKTVKAFLLDQIERLDESLIDASRLTAIPWKEADDYVTGIRNN